MTLQSDSFGTSSACGCADPHHVLQLTWVCLEPLCHCGDPDTACMCLQHSSAWPQSWPSLLPTMQCMPELQLTIGIRAFVSVITTVLVCRLCACVVPGAQVCLVCQT